jgi:hypothetical protein
MLLRHGSQSEELICPDLFMTENKKFHFKEEDEDRKERCRKPRKLKDLNYKQRLLCKSARIIICFMLTIISHFKEEARKDMIEENEEAKSSGKPGDL